MLEPDHYATLQVHPDASDAEIKRSYRRLMRAVHPDANVHDPDANRKAALLNDAFETRRRPESGARLRRPPRPRQRPPLRDLGRAARLGGHRRRERVPARARTRPQSAARIEPDEFEVDIADLRARPRVRRTIRVTTVRLHARRRRLDVGAVGVGPDRHLTAGPGETTEFDVESSPRRCSSPASRGSSSSRDWTGVVPVKITGYEPKRRAPPSSTSAYVPTRRRRAVRPR